MKKTGLILLALTVTFAGCKENREQEAENIQNVETAMQTDESQNEWRDLFNGENLDGWKAYNSDAEPSQWTVEDGVLVFEPADGQRSGSENIISEEEFTDFELALEWKISEGGNSGIMWGVQENEELNEPYYTGPEIQILDNQGHPDAKNGPVRQAGALYDMVPPSQDVTKPAGEWNSMTIRINHEENKGTVTLNGTKTTEFPLHGQEWDELVENSKFSDWEHFGKSRAGHIALQDHDDKVWFRNIRIKELN